MGMVASNRRVATINFFILISLLVFAYSVRFSASPAWYKSGIKDLMAAQKSLALPDSISVEKRRMRAQMTVKKPSFNGDGHPKYPFIFESALKPRV